jgi:GNAT superfamily N-acetyltransferase
MIGELQFKKLAEAPHVVDECGRWLFEEWGYRKKASLIEVQARFRCRMSRNEVPIAFVAIHGHQAAGTISIIDKEDASDEVGPWIASLFVPNAFRGQGIARQLLRTAEDHAVRLKISSIWLSASVPEMYFAAGYTMTALTKNGEPVMMKTLL